MYPEFCGAGVFDSLKLLQFLQQLILFRTMPDGYIFVTFLL